MAVHRAWPFSVSSPSLMIRTPDLSRRRSGALVSIPEEAGATGKLDSKIDVESGVVASPQPPQIKRPVARRVTRQTHAQTQAQKKPPKEPERECGICFELAVSPVRTLCCSHLFCAEHIMAWLHGPASDGCCPSCSAPNLDISLVTLGHPGLTHHVPPPPPPTPRSASPPLSPSNAASVAPYASYPSTPAVLPPRRAPDPASSSSSEEEEDATDYSLPALVYARALQTRRHMPHPFSSVVGVRGAIGRVARIAVWLGLVAVLASRGRWAND